MSGRIGVQWIEEMRKQIKELVGVRERKGWMKLAEEARDRELVEGAEVYLRRLSGVLGGVTTAKEKGDVEKEIEGRRQVLSGVRRKVDVGYRRGLEMGELRGRLEKLTVLDKATKMLVPLVFNACQEILWEILEEQYRKIGRLFYVLVKSRQWGASTITDGIIYDSCRRNPETNALIVAHLDSTAAHLLDIFKRYAREDECELPKRSNDNFLIFKESLSKAWIGTARNSNVGQGTTIHEFHGSETAMWVNGHKLWGNLEPATAQARVRCFESTPDGTGNLLHSHYKLATDPDNFTDMVGIFIGWGKDDSCRNQFESEEHKKRFIETMDGEEQDLLTVHEYNYEQLLWRRKTIQVIESDAHSFGSAKENFKKAYPRTIEEAFTTNVLNAFSDPAKEHINRMIVMKTGPVFKGDINLVKPLEGGYVRDWRSRYELVHKAQGGHFNVWREPEWGRQYIVGVDAAQGKGTTVRNPDYHVAFVLERDTGMHAATWRGRGGLPEFTNTCMAIGSYYHMEHLPALLMIEITGGYGNFVQIQADQAGYPNLYNRESFDSRTGQETSKMGWLTNMATRPVMIGNLDKALSTNWLVSSDNDFLMELSSFENKDSKLEAAYGCHDDIVIASSLAVTAHERLPVIDQRKDDFLDIQKENLKTEILLSKMRQKPGQCVGFYSKVKDENGNEKVIKRDFYIA